MPVSNDYPNNNHLLHIKGAKNYVSMNLALGAAKMEEEDLMQNSKKLKKWGITLAASLVISSGIPAGMTHAAALESANHSLIAQIFKQFGWTWDGAKKVNAQPENPQTSEPSDQTGDSVNNAEQEQSNNGQQNEAEQSATTKADQIIATGEKYLGTPYQFGAKSGQTRTFDCSSFVQHVFKENGIDLPRNSRQQSTVGQTVPFSEIQKGDLLFFELRSNPGRIGHVGIYAGNNKILHTWGSGGVQYDDLSDRWLKEGFVKAQRVIQ